MAGGRQRLFPAPRDLLVLLDPRPPRFGPRKAAVELKEEGGGGEGWRQPHLSVGWLVKGKARRVGIGLPCHHHPATTSLTRPAARCTDSPLVRRVLEETGKIATRSRLLVMSFGVKLHRAGPPLCFDTLRDVAVCRSRTQGSKLKRGSASSSGLPTNRLTLSSQPEQLLETAKVLEKFVRGSPTHTCSVSTRSFTRRVET